MEVSCLFVLIIRCVDVEAVNEVAIEYSLVTFDQSVMTIKLYQCVMM